MTDAFAISDAYVDEVFARSPMTATAFGVAGSDHLWDDMSPAGHDDLADLARATRSALVDHLDDPDPDQAHAAAVLTAQLGEGLQAHAAGDHLRDVNHIYCPVTEVRDIFDIMDRESPSGWADVTTRLATIDQPLAGYRECLDQGLSQGLVAARRQVLSVIEQMRVLAGDDSPFAAYAAQAAETGLAPEARDQLAAAVSHAQASVGALADWFESELLPTAPDQDGVGRDRYERNVQAFIGDDLDLEETYAWGWQELASIWERMEVVAAQIDPEADVREVIERLETDPAQAAPSPQAFVATVQDLLDDAVAKLDGTHFDLPDKMKQVTVNLAPAGGALGAWYINPSEDFTRPGSVWYSLGDQQVIPMWKEVSTAYHEGFPGHHLQVATVMDRAERLSRAHRLLVWYPGYGEGWALYTERLMDELGFLDDPAWKLGMLATHAFRASRVVVDLGLHLGFTIPDDAPMFAGRDWDFDSAVAFMERMGLEDHDVAVSEVKRYLGWPAQAISYKVGERAILTIRDELRERGDFDLNDFHNAVLDGGPLRIDMLRDRMLA
ncbi:MAG TPA: DUF885 domain-containing protein [Nitriliruptoraceae bacterium]|nr:DUF885 domain-containing protein [Nitriliruptoraceae bacterium]